MTVVVRGKQAEPGLTHALQSDGAAGVLRAQVRWLTAQFDAEPDLMKRLSIGRLLRQTAVSLAMIDAREQKAVSSDPPPSPPRGPSLIDDLRRKREAKLRRAARRNAG